MKRRQVMTVWAAISAFSLSLSAGCASKPVSLALDYQPTQTGPLSDLEPTVLSLRVVDHRPQEQRDRIGIQRQTVFGTEHASVMSATPVTQVVYRAVKAELERSGHRVLEPGQGDAATTVRILLTQFFVDSKAAGNDIELLGSVCAEVMTPAGTEDTPYISLIVVNGTFQYRVRMGWSRPMMLGGLSGALLSKTRTRDLQKAMNGALLEFVRHFCLEPDVRQAVARAAHETRAQSPASPATKPQ